MKKTYARRAVKDIGRLNNPIKKRIKNGIESLPLGDVKKLQKHENLYRLRIGDWRIIFSYVDENTILVEEIETRGDVY